ncbi:Protein of unknown function [Aliiroseovarius sediminilitoris]|uniref:DUF2842 domain-containing protein n=1 Tax=Aliiroseovarius sediminilitoris TaxID=1173584 RepID=A0A1I0P3Y1_9RHOB|nr:DUF2842 domain-containing protein [Aliiroseovarius sediminilitoris]SEW08707.1 Protein of unknown function [Aliiroseovarius sediminilitoris]
MALGYKARKRLSLLVLLVGLPLYILVAVKVVSLFDRPPILMELLVYIVLGFLWMIPLRKVFLGVGKPDPDADPDSYPHDPVDAEEEKRGTKK